VVASLPSLAAAGFSGVASAGAGAGATTGAGAGASSLLLQLQQSNIEAKIINNSRQKIIISFHSINISTAMRPLVLRKIKRSSFHEK
jgi:hypothetical protein